MPTETHRNATDIEIVHNTQNLLVQALSSRGWRSGAALIGHLVGDIRHCGLLVEELETVTRAELRTTVEPFLLLAQKIFSLYLSPVDRSRESARVREDRVQQLRLLYVEFLALIPRPANSEWHISRGQREAVIDGIEVDASMETGYGWSITLSDRGIGLPKFYVTVDAASQVDKAARAAVAQYLASIA